MGASSERGTVGTGGMEGAMSDVVDGEGEGACLICLVGITSSSKGGGGTSGTTRRPAFHLAPQALHSCEGPLGPRRHMGVLVLPQAPQLLSVPSGLCVATWRFRLGLTMSPRSSRAVIATVRSVARRVVGSRVSESVATLRFGCGRLVWMRTRMAYLSCM